MSSTSYPRLGTLRLEARFDFFGLGTETIGASSTWPVSRGSVAVVVSTLASMVIEVSSCDIVEIFSLLFRVIVSRLFVCWSFVCKLSEGTYCK